MATLSSLMIFVALLAVSSSKLAHNECGTPKLESCYCGDTFYRLQEFFLVNCTDTGFTNVSMLKELPIETGALIFSGNNIESLPENIFGEDKSYTKLKVIDMSNNHIKRILGKTFHHVPAVETLILNHNDIKIAQDDTGSYYHPRVFSNFVNLRELHLTNAFADNTDDHLANDLHDIFNQSSLTNLFRLHLEQNEIKSFKDPKVFCNLPNLTQLYLGNNFIPHIDIDSFECLKLQFLDLQNNNITEFSEKDLTALDNLETIALKERKMSVDINGNPLKCSKADNLYNWLLETNVEVHHIEQIQCYIATGSGSKPVNLLTTFKGKYGRLSTASTVLLVILCIACFTLGSGYAYINWNNLKQRFSPFLDVVSRKVHYTTLDSQIV